MSELSEPAAVGFDEKGDGGGVKDINEAEILGIKGTLNLRDNPPPPSISPLSTELTRSLHVLNLIWFGCVARLY